MCCSGSMYISIYTEAWPHPRVKWGKIVCLLIEPWPLLTSGKHLTLSCTVQLYEHSCLCVFTWVWWLSMCRCREEEPDEFDLLWLSSSSDPEHTISKVHYKACDVWVKDTSSSKPHRGWKGFCLAGGGNCDCRYRWDWSNTTNALQLQLKY